MIFQVVFVARLAEEEGAFDLADAIEAVHAKMVERHPHVFGDDKLDDAAAVHRAWERRKLAQGSTPGGGSGGLLQGIPASLPALTGALRITQKAAGVGFDWPSSNEVLDKVHEELAEVAEAEASGDRLKCQEEIGDLLFTVVNLARHLGINPESALAGANGKFRRRFGAVEAAFEDRQRGLVDATLDEMEDAWQTAKRAERG